MGRLVSAVAVGRSLDRLGLHGAEPQKGDEIEEEEQTKGAGPPPAGSLRKAKEKSPDHNLPTCSGGRTPPNMGCGKKKDVRKNAGCGVHFPGEPSRRVWEGELPTHPWWLLHKCW